MDKFEKGQLMNKLCHALLREAAEAGFSVADVSKIPDRLRNIIEMSTIGDSALAQGRSLEEIARTLHTLADAAMFATMEDMKRKGN